MPVYEEKLLCPLAIRFTQGHIRSAFRDGRELEASRAEIRAAPGSDGYDVVLEAPFPSIEIVRWAPGHRSQSGGGCASRSDGQSEGSGSDDPDDERWFTYDNRRLYCLQQAALAHWPKRVAAVVQVMYASNRNMLKRKFDSTSLGREIDIMRMGEDTPYTTFNWRRAVALSAPRLAAAAAFGAAALDEEKDSVAELEDVPQAPSGLERMLLALAQEERQLEEQRARAQQAAAPQAPSAGPGGAGARGAGARDAGALRARRFQNRGGRMALAAAASPCVPVAA